MVCVWGGGAVFGCVCMRLGRGVCGGGEGVCVFGRECVCVWEGVCVCLCLCVCVVGRGCLGAGISHSGGEGLNTLAAEISLQSTL